MRVRFMTSHPKDMSDDIIDAVAANEKVCEFFHLPLQSGDDDILRLMNRGYSSGDYRRIVEKIRKKVPDAAITSDVIAGFPRRQTSSSRILLRLIDELELDSCNTLAFDPRPGTKAYQMEGKVPHTVIKERLRQLMEKVGETAMKKNRKLVGSIQELLVEKEGMGRTRTNKIVRFKDHTARPGELLDVKIISAGSWVLLGEAAR